MSARRLYHVEKPTLLIYAREEEMLPVQITHPSAMLFLI